MLPYIVSFLGLALFPLALAGYGGHLATIGLTEQKQRKHALLIVWGLAALGVVFTGLQQVQAYHSDKEHDEQQEGLKTKLDSSMQAQQYMRGQLDSIGLMIGRVGEKNTDPVLGELAGAIVKMSDNARASMNVQTSVVPDLHLQILHERTPLSGRTITISGEGPRAIRVADVQVHNGAERPTGRVSVRLYFSKRITGASPFPTMNFPWQTTSSDEQGFPSAFYSAGIGSDIVINPTETWNWPDFTGVSDEDLDELSAKIKLFYGAAKPAEAAFILRRKK